MSNVEFTGFPEGPKTRIWPEGKMPDVQPHQYAAMTEEVLAPGFNPDDYRMPTLQWLQPPSKENATDVCMVVISGGGYNSCCDIPHMSVIVKEIQKAGIHCVNFSYRIPRPEGIPIYKTAWDDAQRAIRLVRLEAKKRGFSPEKIGIMGCSAGSHLGLLLALSSRTPAYAPVDEIDEVPCHISWAVAMCPSYVLSDGFIGPNEQKGHGDDITITPAFAFDEGTCPVCFMHGEDDPYSPMGSVRTFCRLRGMGIPAELHLEENAVHGFACYKRIVPSQVILDFLKHRGFLSGTASAPMANRTAEEEIALATAWGKRREQGIEEDLHIC